MLQRNPLSVSRDKAGIPRAPLVAGIRGNAKVRCLVPDGNSSVILKIAAAVLRREHNAESGSILLSHPLEKNPRLIVTEPALLLVRHAKNRAS